VGSSPAPRTFVRSAPTPVRRSGAPDLSATVLGALPTGSICPYLATAHRTCGSHHPRRAWCMCERCCADRSDALRPIDLCPILGHVAGARPTSADPTHPNHAVLAAGRRVESCPWCSGQPPEIRVCCAFAAVGDGTPAWADARHRFSYAGSRPDRRAAGLLPLTAASAVNRRDPRRDPFFDASKANSCVDNAYPVGQCDQRVAFDLRDLRNVSS
jgi:hypothetical protein